MKINIFFFLRQSLKRAVNIDKSHSELHTCIVRYLKYYQEKLSTTEGPVVDVIRKELSNFTTTLDPVIFNEDFLNKFQDCIPHRFQGTFISLLKFLTKLNSLSFKLNIIIFKSVSVIVALINTVNNQLIHVTY